MAKKQAAPKTEKKELPKRVFCRNCLNSSDIGISGHCNTGFDPGYCMTEPVMKKYFAGIVKIRQTSEIIHVFARD